jgi:AcrR family transcriptional regulator
MTPRPDVSEERKAQIYEAALKCFGGKGYHRTTMDDIVAESGLSKGTLYWYFKSKKELFLGLFRDLMAQFGKAWESIVADQEASATEKLLTSLTLFRAEFVEMVPLFGVMMEAWALTRHDEDVQRLARELYEPYLDIMTRIIEEGVANGEFQVDSPGATTLVIMTLFDGIILAMGTGLWQYDWNEVMDAAAELVLRGLGVERGHQSEESEAT